MDATTALTLGLHVVLLLCASAGKTKQSDRCDYIQTSDWSVCDRWTMTSTRSLELVSGDTGMCEQKRLERRDCGKEVADVDMGDDGSTRHKLNKRKRLKRKKKKSHLPDCKYKKSKWSNCDSNEYTQTLVQTLQSGSAAECQPVVVMTRACVTELEMVEAEEEKTGGGVRRGRKNGKEHRRKRKQKNNNKMELKKNKKKIDIKNSSELPQETPSHEPMPDELPSHKPPTQKPPPQPAELNVEPHATSAVVSWQPPRDDAGQHIPVISYKIGYGQGFPDLQTLQVDGQEVTYRIQNLEPGREYIVSLRAKTRWGVSQPLYETIRTHSAGEASLVSEQLMLPPVGVRLTVLSSEAINVTWVDQPNSGESTSKKKDYYVRYRKLNHLSNSASSHENDFKIQHTPDQYVVVDGLQPFTKYEFAVMTSDGERNSSWSVLTWNVTLQAAPSSAPGDLTIIPDPNNHKQVVVSWQPPAQANGVLTGYHVSYSSVSVDGDSLIETKDVLGTQLSVTLTNLIPGRTYNFSVRAINSQGLGPRLTFRNYHFLEELPSQSSYADVDTFPDLIPEHDDGDDDDDEGDGDNRQSGNKFVEPARKLHVDVLSATSAVVTWQDPGLLDSLEDETTSEVPAYSVRYRSLDIEHPNYTLLPCPLTSLYVDDLTPLTWYEFMVKVHRGHQESEWSLPVKNRTFAADHKLAVTLPRPNNLQVIVMSPNSALITWQEPHLVKNKVNIPPTSMIYTLRYRDLTRRSSAYMFAAPTLTSIFMVDLEPATKYEFSVRTDSGGQHSEWSVPVVNTTFDSAPSTGPSHVKISLDDGDPTTAFLTWHPPEVPNGNITGYIVFYETVTDRRSATVPAGELSYRIPFLKPHTKYFFRVGAWNSQGFSPLSNRVVYRTPRVVGMPPADVTVSPASDDLYNAIVSWQPPSPNKRKIKFYTVTRYTEDGKQRTVLKVPAYTLTTLSKKLLPSTVYHFTVQAHYQRDSGPHSPAVQYSIPKELL